MPGDAAGRNRQHRLSIPLPPDSSPPLYTGGEVSWKPVGTSWVHCRLWIIFPPMYPPITSGVHPECNLNMCPACIHQITFKMLSKMFLNVPNTCAEMMFQCAQHVVQLFAMYFQCSQNE